jgi:hypothetical protein
MCDLQKDGSHFYQGAIETPTPIVSAGEEIREKSVSEESVLSKTPNSRIVLAEGDSCPANPS